MILPPPRPTLFPYTTLFRSGERAEFCIVFVAGQAECRGAERFGLVGRGELAVVHGDELIEDDIGQSVDRKSTRLNSSHRCISYAVFCLKKKKKKTQTTATHI